MNQLRCEPCDIDLHGRDIDFGSGLPRCRTCGTPVEKNTRSRRSSLPQEPGTTVMPLPPQIDVQQGPDGAEGTALRISVPWRNQGSSSAGELATILIVGGAAVIGDQLDLYWLVTVGIVALSIIGLLAVRAVNRTVITVARGSIRVRHRPIPWLSHTVAADSIEQLYVDRRPVAQKRFDYNVRAQLTDGEDIKLLRSLSEPMVALYLEQCLESHLHIVDRAVQGEYKRQASHWAPEPEPQQSPGNQP